MPIDPRTKHVVGMSGPEFLNKMQDLFRQGYEIVQGTPMLFMNPYTVDMIPVSDTVATAPSGGVSQSDYDDKCYELLDAKDMLDSAEREIVKSNETIIALEDRIAKLNDTAKSDTPSTEVEVEAKAEVVKSEKTPQQKAAETRAKNKAAKESGK